MQHDTMGRAGIWRPADMGLNSGSTIRLGKSYCYICQPQFPMLSIRPSLLRLNQLMSTEHKAEGGCSAE